MGAFEDAVIYATRKHNNQKRKVSGIPSIMHSLEVAHIISTITSDEDIMIAGLLHDVVEDTDGTLAEIRAQFGERVAALVSSETEQKCEHLDPSSSWQTRKEESIKRLEQYNDRDIETLWLADKLSNIRSFVASYSEQGEALWDSFHQKDPQKQLWYYKSIADILEMNFNKTAAFKEYIKHINYIWPGTFPPEKEKYKKYRQVSIDNCKLLGTGAKGDVYRYNDELVLKLYHEDTRYSELEQDIRLSRLAFVAGIPTAIPFGIVEVGSRYGSMFEMMDSNTVSSLIAANPGNAEAYASIMADLAKSIHSADVFNKLPDLPKYRDTVHTWINGGLAIEDEALSTRLHNLVDQLPDSAVIHGDFHTGNVMSHMGEYMLIDMNRISISHPIIELSSMYMFYIGFGELDANVVEDYMGFSYDTSKAFFYSFMRHYLGTDNIDDVVDRAALLAYVRLLRRCYKKGRTLSDKNAAAAFYYMNRIHALLDTVDSLEF